jgi:hypothetical protein
MTVNYTDSDIVNGHLNVNTGTEDYTVNVDLPVIIDMGRNERGSGVINLSDGNDLINYTSVAGAVINMGAGNDMFNQAKSSAAVIDFTGGPGNDIVWLQGAHMTANYSFSTLQNGQLTSGDGADTLTGKGAPTGHGPAWIVGTDVLAFHISGATVNAQNFSQFFNVTDTKNGDVITDKSGDGFSITLVGVHLTAQQLLDHGAFHFS